MFTTPHLAVHLLAVQLFLVAFLWFYKAFKELGLDNVRGQFYFTMGIAFVFQGIGFTLTHYDPSQSKIILPFVGLLAYIMARFFFFVSNFRYIFYFQSLGYRLTGVRVALVLLFVVGITAATVSIPNVVGIFKTLSPYIVFILLDVFMVFIVYYNLFLLWGSEITKKWLIGCVVITTYILGDAMFIGSLPAVFPVFLWMIASALMGLIATLKG